MSELQQVSSVTPPWDRFATGLEARSPWVELRERMRTIVNESRRRVRSCEKVQEVQPHEVIKRGKSCAVCGQFLRSLRPYTPLAFEQRVEAYVGSGSSEMRLQRLDKLEADCLEAASIGFGRDPYRVRGTEAYAKCFEWSVKQAMGPVQGQLIAS